MKNIFVLLLMILVATSCDRNIPNNYQSSQDQLPAATQTGANTAGCYINGKLLIPKNGNQSIGGQTLFGLQSSVGPNFNNPPIGNDKWDMLITDFINKTSLSIELANLSERSGIYPLNPYTKMHFKNTEGAIFSSTDNSGTITITRFDYLSGIYSGTFTGTLKNNANPGDIVVVTEGRFDINYTTLNH